MRRAITVAVVLAAVATTIVVVRGSGADASAGYRVDVVFDTAKGLIAGNQVMIAGAHVGTVDKIKLTAAYKARIEMTIERRYAPFHDDARCEIRPVALIGEMEINCDPGTARAGLLTSSRGEPPTVAVARTTVPVDFTDLFDIWTTPVDQRLSEALWTLGAGVAGSGQDLNAVLRRTNPALTLARQTIATVNRHRAQLATLLSAGDRVLAPLAANRQLVPAFLEHAAAVTTDVAAHHGALHAAIGRLPALLDAVDGTLPQLDAATAQAAPLLRDLRVGAAGLARVAGDVPPLARAASPALQRIGLAAASGRRSLPELAPLIAKLQRFTHAARPVAGQMAQLFSSLRATGFIENLNTVPYYLGSAAARYDGYSHLIAANFLLSACAGSAQSNLSGCSGHYGAARKRRRARPRPPQRPGRAPAITVPSAPNGAPQITVPEIPLPAIVKKLLGGGQLPSGDPPTDSVKHLLDYLLK